MLPPSVYERLGLARVREKVLAGERLNLEEGLRLLDCPDLLAVGALAHHVRTRLHGPTTYYVVNQHINYSNVCVNGCRFCAFARERGRPGAFELSVEEILQKVRERLHDPITEIHIVGGCHPDLRLETFERLLREIRRIRPGVRLKAFTAVEIDHFARLEGISTRAVLQRLQAAGLDMLPGGGAEVFSPRIRRLLCPDKLSGDGWLRVVREAHELGIKTNATMLFGHKETLEERLEHLDALRRLQDETDGFVCFIPLPFQPHNTKVEDARGTTGVEELRTIAVSRLMLDNIPHIKAYWVMLTVKLAQVALHFGADDLDGTVVEEKIGHMAGAESEQALTRTELERLIREAGFEPVERDCFFEKVQKVQGEMLKAKGQR
ncbi:aminodeoxyfutalosine synthase [Desulfacinum infernum DSM 9756]|uniref:Aminodeoxyfutalosine synthase n=1 Tax=Desulfacinum infernum DSM 9756 TaxID=1121391 RepID=A0A1M4W7T9_9BACT|nr:aminofutalosine synthase MqnE [Desulfacinum infernum]SHE77328.1 aminodeoxyfutalosine synthase [Desulfacinum infernum DSM 9756]